MYELGVRALLTDKDNRILLVRNINGIHSSKWVLPGGKVEKGELAENSVIREVREELGLNLIPKFYSYREDITSSKDKFYIIFFFEGSYEGELKLQETELHELRFVDLQELETLDIGYPHKEVMVEFLERFK